MYRIEIFLLSSALTLIKNSHLRRILDIWQTISENLDVLEMIKFSFWDLEKF